MFVILGIPVILNTVLVELVRNFTYQPPTYIQIVGSNTKKGVCNVHVPPSRNLESGRGSDFQSSEEDSPYSIGVCSNFLFRLLYFPFSSNSYYFLYFSLVLSLSLSYLYFLVICIFIYFLCLFLFLSLFLGYLIFHFYFFKLVCLRHLWYS